MDDKTQRMETDEDLSENSSEKIFLPFWKVKTPEITPPPKNISASVASLNILETCSANTSRSMSIVLGEVLETILKKSDTRDLHNFRLVSKRWAQLANHILLQRKDNEIEFTFCTRRRQFFRQSRLSMCLDCFHSAAQHQDQARVSESRPLRKRTLNDFASYLCCSIASGRIFPCVRFRFNGGHLSSSESQHFFKVYGKLVKGLCLDMDSDSDLNGDEEILIESTDKKSLNNIIFHHLPNLESLNIASLPRLWEITERVEDVPGPEMEARIPVPAPVPVPGLPRLLSLTRLEIGETSVNLFGEMSHLLHSVMNSAPNITEIYFSESFTPNFLQLFLPSRLHLLRIHSLNLNLFQDSLNYLEQLSHCDFALKSLNLDVKDGKVFWESDEERKSREISRRVSSLSRILERSVLSMDHLGLLSGALKFLMKISIPIFPCVKSLYLDFRNASSLKLPSQYFPPCPVWTNLPLVFPQLWEVTMDVGLGLSMTNSRTSGSDPNFPCWNQQQVTTVKKLSILGYPSPRTVENLSRIFPHVETLTVSDVTDFPRAAASIWKLKRLKHLKLQFVTDPVHMNYHYPAFDEGFTGFTKETVIRLKEEPKSAAPSPVSDLSKMDLKRLNELRVKTSMLNLADLESLDVKFVNWEGLAQDSSQFLSDVTTKCVFERMKNLEWNIHLNQQPPHDDEDEQIE